MSPGDSSWNETDFFALCPGFFCLYTVLQLPLNWLGIMQCLGLYIFFSQNNESV